MYTIMRPKGKQQRRQATHQLALATRAPQQVNPLHTLFRRSVFDVWRRWRRQKMRARIKRATVARGLDSAVGREVLPDAILASCELHLKRSGRGLRFLLSPLLAGGMHQMIWKQQADS